jgi:hypothetical protein
VGPLTAICLWRVVGVGPVSPSILDDEGILYTAARTGRHITLMGVHQVNVSAMMLIYTGTVNSSPPMMPHTH